MHVRYIDTQQALSGLVELIAECEAIAVDTEFHGERSWAPHLMLIQIATPDAIYLVDPLAEMDLEPLVDAFARPELVVVGHALRNDLEIFWLRFGKLPGQIFDTQVAAAFLGHGLQAGLRTLVGELLDIKLAKGAQMADWSKRPLPKRQVEYAASDVAYLLEIYGLLKAQLDERRRSAWVREECDELLAPALYERDSGEAWRRVKGTNRLRGDESGVLVELAAARDQIARERDLVPHFLVSDDILVAIAQRKPTDEKSLTGDRRLKHRNVRKYAEQWLAAVERGRGKRLPRPRGRRRLTPETETAARLAMLLIQSIAHDRDLAPQLLLRREDLHDALQDRPESAEALMAAAELTGWRAELLQGPLWAFLQGELHVRCVPADGDGYRVVFDA